MRIRTTDVCSIDGCGKQYYAKGFCRYHYKQHLREQRTEQCAIDGCEKTEYRKGLCSKHYRASLVKPNVKCSHIDCENPSFAKGLCKIHYNQEHHRRIDVRFKAAKREAKRRKIKWTLTIEQYSQLVTNSSCHYCDGSLPVTGAGLDRLDSNKGYTIDNVAPCCFECNTMKNSHMTEQEMLQVTALLRAIRNNEAFAYNPTTE